MWRSHTPCCRRMLEGASNRRYAGFVRLREDVVLLRPMSLAAAQTKLEKGFVASSASSAPADPTNQQQQQQQQQPQQQQQRVLVSSCDHWWGVNDKAAVLLRPAMNAYFDALLSFYLEPDIWASDPRIVNPERLVRALWAARGLRALPQTELLPAIPAVLLSVQREVSVGAGLRDIYEHTRYCYKVCFDLPRFHSSGKPDYS